MALTPHRSTLGRAECYQLTGVFFPVKTLGSAARSGWPHVVIGVVSAHLRSNYGFILKMPALEPAPFWSQLFLEPAGCGLLSTQLNNPQPPFPRQPFPDNDQSNTALYNQHMARSKSFASAAANRGGGVPETKDSAPDPPAETQAAPAASATENRSSSNRGGGSPSSSTNPQTPTKRPTVGPTPPRYEASAEQLKLYADERHAGKPCPRCAWPMILVDNQDPKKLPRPGCIRWKHGDCAFLGLTLQWGGKFCWVCGTKLSQGDIVWVYGESERFFSCPT